MSPWRASSKWAAAVAAALALAGCGGQAREARQAHQPGQTPQPGQNAIEPIGTFAVDVPIAKFPRSQRLAEHTHLVIAVRNSGTRTIPNIAVTILNPKEGVAAQAFGGLLAETQGLASRSRPIWIVDRAPGPCAYNCSSGGPGGAVTANTNTWALGALKPGDTATFDWRVTAVKAGTHVIEYRVAAGLGGNARAVLAGGGQPRGTFTVKISRTPQRSYVNDNGQVVNTP